ncbi:MAG TPA: thymidylate synthase [Candidatus Nanoarchaeia archaeon]|nr:thymidylate synthase [Candidatus Nanoarchaeia archaeon]
MAENKGLILGSEKSCVAVCTLWTQTDRFEEVLLPDEYRLIGNLYSFNGISKLIRTIFTYPEIRYIVMCGLDLGKAGEALLLLMKNGVDDNNKIIGNAVIIEKEIPKEKIDFMRRNVEVIDLRNIIKPEKVKDTIKELKRKEPFSEKVEFPEPEAVKPSQFPADDSGFLVHEEKIALAWPKILGDIMRFGSQKKSHYQDVKEITNYMAVIDKEDPDKPFLPPFLGLTKESLEEYYPQILTYTEFEGTSYTYGQRLRHVPKKAEKEMREMIDQIAQIVEELKKSPYSRRAIATTWRIEEDMNNQNPPCLITIQCSLTENKLSLTGYFRSNDMFAAWPKNAFGLRKLQQLIANQLDAELGPLTIISASAHIYEPDWKAAEEIAQDYTTLRWRQDKRGYFVLKVEKGKIRLQHYDNNGPLLQTFEGVKAEEIYKELILKETMSYPEHLAYIGMELAKAEIALKLGIPYVQEEDLEFP